VVEGTPLLREQRVKPLKSSNLFLSAISKPPRQVTTSAHLLPPEIHADRPQGCILAAIAGEVHLKV
jgi:hypothetical protein